MTEIQVLLSHVLMIVTKCGEKALKLYPKRFKTGHFNYIKSNFAKAIGQIKILFSTLIYYFKYS